MATYALKSTGLAALATMVVMVDSDGTTLREFVSSTVNGTMTVSAALTTGTKSWKGTNRNYWAQTANGSFEVTPEVEFNTNFPTVLWTSGAAVFAACAQMSSTGNDQGAVVINASNGWGFGPEPETDGGFGFMAGAVRMASSGDPIPLGTTSFSMGGNLTANATYDIWYAAEGGTTPTTFNVTNGTDAGWGIGSGEPGTPSTITEIGGFHGQGNKPAQYHIVAMFNRELTASEFGTLHDDWFGTLFDVIPGSATMTCTSGSYVLTGNSQNLTRGPVPMVAESGTYTLSGQNIISEFVVERMLEPTYGLYTLVGSDAIVDTGMNVESGVYEVTGYDQTLTYTALTNPSMQPDSGSYTLTGNDQNFNYIPGMQIIQGVYGLIGNSQILRWSEDQLLLGLVQPINISKLRIGL